MKIFSKFRTRLLFPLGLLIIGSSTHAAALRTAALTGQPAPGTPDGVTYESFGSHLVEAFLYHGVVLNDAGQVAFRANLAGDSVDLTNNQGVWSEDSGSLSLVARTGNQAPGTPSGVSFRTDPAAELFSPVLNNAGQTAFYAATTDGGLGLWSEGSGSLAPVARSGDQAPGTPSGVHYTFTNLQDFVETPVLNDAGKTSFRSYLSGPGVSVNNLQGLWSEGSGSLNMLSRLGTHATGLPAGVNHGYAFSAGLNDTGQSVFFSFLSGSGVNNSNDRSLWMDSSGSPTLLARTGSQAPGMPTGTNFNAFYNTASINNVGQAIFVAGLSSENSEHRQDSLWMSDAGTLKLLARRGTQAPGAADGVTYDAFGGWPELNDAGQAVFLAVLMGPGVHENNDVALFLTDAQGNTSQVARKGFQAPGTPAGTVFTPGLNPVYNAPVLNNAGQIAYMAALAGPEVDSTNDFGIWATDHAGATQLIVRKGDLLEVAAGDLRTVSELNFVGGNSNSNGWPSAFNNVGQVAFWASFTDGSQGIFVSNEVATVPGDFNRDGTVDTGDYIAWRDGLGTFYSQSHYDIWRAHYGQTLADSLLASAGTVNVPVLEPSASAIVLCALFGSLVLNHFLPAWRLRTARQNASCATPLPAAMLRRDLLSSV